MKKRIIIPIVILLVIAGACGIYIGQYYHADPAAQSIADRAGAAEAQGSNVPDSVQVSEFGDGLLLDGPGEDEALIFYPGAKVEYIAYAKLLEKLAEDGTDCFLVKMPCNFAFLGVNKATDIMAGHEYKHWFVAGHSLGGAMAAIYASENDLDGLILLGAYTTKEIDEPSLEIYGSEDGVLNMQKLQEGNALFLQKPQVEVIKGGNHAQFGDYGEQKGDGEATISREKQQQITVEKMEEFIDNVY